MQNQTPGIGDFVEFRGRPWLVEGIEDKGGGLSALKRSCISDDAQGEALEVAWDVEIGAGRLEDDLWSRFGRSGTDDAATFAAYLPTLKWNTATAADRDLFQAPFRTGIRLDTYQLLPLRKALRLPCVEPSTSVQSEASVLVKAAEALVTAATDPNELAVNVDEDGRAADRRGYYDRSCGPVGHGRGAIERSQTAGMTVDGTPALTKQSDTWLDAHVEWLNGR